MADIDISQLTYLKAEIDTKMSDNLTTVQAALATKVDVADLGSPSGVATLDASGDLNLEQEPPGYNGDVSFPTDGITLTFVNGRVTAVS